LLAAQAQPAGRQEGQGDDVLEHRLVAMPADRHARVIFGDQRLLQALYVEAGDGGGQLAQGLEEIRHRFTHPERTAGIVVAPAERYDPPFAEITVEFEGLERQGFELVHPSALFGVRKRGGLI